LSGNRGLSPVFSSDGPGVSIPGAESVYSSGLEQVGAPQVATTPVRCMSCAAKLIARL
jgi:hypothetical protein